MREKGRLRFRLALRRSHLAGAGAEDEASDNPDRNLIEDDAKEEAEEKRRAGGELVHGGRLDGASASATFPFVRIEDRLRPGVVNQTCAQKGNL